MENNERSRIGRPPGINATKVSLTIDNKALDAAKAIAASEYGSLSAMATAGIKLLLEKAEAEKAQSRTAPKSSYRSDRPKIPAKSIAKQASRGKTVSPAKGDQTTS